MNDVTDVFDRAKDALGSTQAESIEIFTFWFDETDFNSMLERWNMVEPDGFREMEYEERIQLALTGEEMFDIVQEELLNCDDIERLKEFTKKFK